MFTSLYKKIEESSEELNKSPEELTQTPKTLKIIHSNGCILLQSVTKLTTPIKGDIQTYIHVWDKNGESVLGYVEYEDALLNYSKIQDFM
jgi:hypothetical protein